MKKSINLFALTFIMTVTLFSSTTVNQDKPANGSWDFKPEKVWSLEGFKDDLFAMVQKYVVTEQDKIYLFDRRHYKFFVFDKDGKPLFSFGKRGEGPGEIKFALSLFLVNNKIFVYDMGKIHIFSLEGQFIKSITAGSTTVGKAPLLFLDENRMIKTRSQAALNAPPEALEIFNFATKKTIYLDGKPKDDDTQGRGGISVMIQIGTGQLERSPGYIATAKDGTILWGSSDKYLIHGSDYSGKENFSFSIEGRKRYPISQKDKERMVGRMRFRSDSASEEELKKRLIKNIPDESTYFSRLVFADNGLIFVFISDAGRENGQAIDIFSKEGKYLYRADIILPGVQRIMGNGLLFNDNFLYLAGENEDGDIRFAKYRVQIPNL